jgi:D-alanyl-D-alanine carboxypeptidase/D-alanyl-D-alanine-endopeptidase (penicillin-binding protein 4)
MVKEAKGWGGTASAMVVEVASGAVLAAAEEHAAMNPASNAKLATAAAALRALGPEHRFLTGLYGKLSGDRVAALVLRGFGDPTLTSDDLAALARELKERGVRKVGDVLVDQGYFDDAFTPPAFAQQPNEWAPFRAPVSAVAVDANTVLVTARPGEEGKPATVKVSPPGVAVISGTVRTTKKGDPEKLGVSVSAGGAAAGAGGAAGGLTVQVSGHVPEGGAPVTVARRLDDPRVAPGFALKAALVAAGIEVTGEVRQGGEKERGLLASHRSDSLAHVLARLGKDSDNFVAEMVFKALAAEKKARPGTFAAASEVVSGELRALGAFESGCVVANGSGLFDANRTTAAATVALLRNGYLDSKIGPELVAHLAVGGVDGTLRARFKAWSRARAVRAKTGTLNAVFALSGYVLSPPGKSPVAFALFVNGAPGKAGPARAAMDRVVDATARAAWGAPP